MSFSVLGTGSYVPAKIVTNNDLAQLVDTSDEWITQRVGVKERHICVNETAADLAYQAALQALQNSGCPAAEVDLILAATVSGELITPSISCQVQEKLGVSCLAFDLNAACSAFLFLLETASAYFALGYQKILVIGTERMSRLVDWHDRNTCVIFGDGAGALLLGTGNNYLASVFTVKGGSDVLKIPNFAGNSPYYLQKTEPPYVQMNGQETFKYAVNAICQDVQTLLQQENLSLDQIDYIVPHQANKRIIDLAGSKLHVAADKFYLNIERYGNTSSASIPLALDEMNRQGLLHAGSLLLLTAFGGGLANASCLLRW